MTDRGNAFGGVVLSLCPGIGLLDQAFEEAGFCVVRGPDLLWGGDIRRFCPPTGVFWGVIGGPPCQGFSRLLRSADDPGGKRRAESQDILNHFVRCIAEARPEWYLIENVDRVPSVTELSGWQYDLIRDEYTNQRFPINQAWYSEVSRLRHIQFGSRSAGRLLDIEPRVTQPARNGAALASDDRSFGELCRLQGLPEDFDLPGFTVEGKKRAVGNGVPLMMGRALAEAVVGAYRGSAVTGRRCLCGCGRPVLGKARYAANKEGRTDACRKRAERKRRRGIVGSGY